MSHLPGRTWAPGSRSFSIPEGTNEKHRRRGQHPCPARKVRGPGRTLVMILGFPDRDPGSVSAPCSLCSEANETMAADGPAVKVGGTYPRHRVPSRGRAEEISRNVCLLESSRPSHGIFMSSGGEESQSRRPARVISQVIRPFIRRFRRSERSSRRNRATLRGGFVISSRAPSPLGGDSGESRRGEEEAESDSTNRLLRFISARMVFAHAKRTTPPVFLRRRRSSFRSRSITRRREAPGSRSRGRSAAPCAPRG